MVGYYLDNTMPYVGKLIAKLRNERGWTQQQLSVALRDAGYHFSRGYLGGVERGHVEPSKQLLVGCEAAFGLPRGTMIKYAVHQQAERLCQEMKLTLTEYINLVEQGSKGDDAPPKTPESSPDGQPVGSGNAGDPVATGPLWEKRLIRDVPGRFAAVRALFYCRPVLLCQ